MSIRSAMKRQIIIPSMSEREMEKLREYSKNNPESYAAFNITDLKIRPSSSESMGIMPSILRKDYIYENVVIEFLYPRGYGNRDSEKKVIKKTQEGLIDLLSTMLKKEL